MRKVEYNSYDAYKYYRDNYAHLFDPASLCVQRTCRYDRYLSDAAAPGGWYRDVVTAAYPDESDVVNVNHVRYSTKTSLLYDEEDYYRKVGIDRHSLTQSREDHGAIRLHRCDVAGGLMIGDVCVASCPP